MAFNLQLLPVLLNLPLWCPAAPQAMFRDHKLNPMQHSTGKLKELLEAYTYWKPSAKHDFRAPNKPPTKHLMRGLRVDL
jgi:hypothetical protein